MHGEVQPDGAPGVALEQQFVEVTGDRVSKRQAGDRGQGLASGRQVTGDRDMAPKCHVPVPIHLNRSPVT